jgi:hypothetical protein
MPCRNKLACLSLIKTLISYSNNSRVEGSIYQIHLCLVCRHETQHRNIQHNDSTTTLHNDSEHNDSQHNDTQHKRLICDMSVISQ